MSEIPPSLKAKLVEETFTRLRVRQVDRQRAEFDELMDSLFIVEEPLRRQLWLELQRQSQNK